MMKKRLSAILLAVCILLSLQTASFAGNDVIDSGKWGDNISWKITDDGVLTIYGNGMMIDSIDPFPWRSFENYDSYSTIIVEEGVTYIAEGAFSSFGGSSVTKIYLPSTLNGIGAAAFEWVNVKEVHIPSIEDWLEINFDPFYATPFAEMGGTILYINEIPTTDIEIPYGTTVINTAQFQQYGEMTSVKIPNTVTYIDDYAFDMGTGYITSKLTEITFPASVEYIGQGALRMPRSMEKITILNPECELNNIFDVDHGEEWMLMDFPGAIYGYAGSTAEELAKKYDLPFVALENKPEEKPSITFADIKDSDWWTPYITPAAAAGLVAGNADGTYNPKGELTWAQTLVFATRLDQYNKGEHIYGAEDQIGKWYQIYLDYCLAEGIISDAPANMNGAINRADAAIIFAEVLGNSKKVNDVPEDFFSDVKIGDAAYEAVMALTAAGITNGMGDGSFGVNGGFTRAQVAAMVSRIAGLIAPATIF